MHDFVFIIKVFGESACWYIFYLPFKYFRDWISHLLEYVEEEHEFIFSLLTISHIFSPLINCILEVLILLEYPFPLFRLFLKLTTISIKNKVEFEIFLIHRWSILHLIFKNQASSLLVFKYLSLKLFYLIVTFVNLACHLMDMSPCLCLISLKVLHFFFILFDRNCLVSDLPMSILQLLLAFIYLIFFVKQGGRYALMDSI